MIYEPKESSPPNYPIAVKPSLDIDTSRPFNTANRPLVTDDRWLCSVLERLGAHQDDERTHLYGTPWLSPILGTGCLDLDDGPQVDLTKVAEVTDRVLRSLTATPDRERARDLGDPGLLAQGFAQQLIRDRSHDRQSAERVVAPTEGACLLLLASALLTRLYHAAQMSAPTPSTRTSNRDVAVLEGVLPHDVHLREAVIPFLRGLLQWLEVRDPDDTRIRSRRALSRRVRMRLDQPTSVVHFEDVRLLTELSWLALTQGTGIYPGWSDLLLDLLVSDQEEAPTGTRPRLTNLTEMGAKVASLLEGPSQASWSTRFSATQRNRFYASVAELLQEQAELFGDLRKRIVVDDDDDVVDDDDDVGREGTSAVEVHPRAAVERDAVRAALAATDPYLTSRGRTKPREPEPPHAVALITSFDLELEMALWTKGLCFTVVVPFLIARDPFKQADVVWLAASVQPPVPGGDLGEFGDLRSAARGWRLASGEFDDVSAGGDAPVVVRLSGSPLMELPDISGGTDLRKNLSSLGFSPGGRKVKIYHALTIDEYTSLRQSESEIFFAATAPEAGSSMKPRGLPQALSSGTATNSRVWVGLGVQIDDPVIRTRVFAQLSAASLQRRIDEQQRQRGGEAQVADPQQAARLAPSAPAILGLVVNRRADDAELLGLRWLGFQIALDLDCASLIDDLEHCTTHVNQLRAAAKASGTQMLKPLGTYEDPNWERAGNETCDLPRTRTKR